jgi:hypothetical protein
MTAGDLRIGAGNFFFDESPELPRISAGLWLFVRDREDLDRHVRVHEGEQIEIAGYMISVDTILKGERKRGMVYFRLRQP